MQGTNYNHWGFGGWVSFLHENQGLKISFLLSMTFVYFLAIINQLRSRSLEFYPPLYFFVIHLRHHLLCVLNLPGTLVLFFRARFDP